MKYGLIGEKLTHSFSKEVHSYLCDYDYELKELSPEKLESFFNSREFSGINVTIPYKTDVIKYLDYVDEAASKIGAVNTVVNRGGKLYGYNTDVYGLTSLIENNLASFSSRGFLNSFIPSNNIFKPIKINKAKAIQVTIKAIRFAYLSFPTATSIASTSQ